MSVFGKLFPPANREAAGVAFIRTFWQTVRATGLLGGAGAIAINAAEFASIDWVALAVGAGLVVASGLLAGWTAAGDILVHGLPAAYKTP